MNKYYFQDKARSERYFTATLLSHLLMANNFEGTKVLFRYLLKNQSLDEGEDFEIVTELDPLRDASISNPTIHQLFKDNGRIAVPDIFIRWGTYSIIIEAKFFTLPYEEDLEYQSNEQKRAINLIVEHTEYDKNKIHYCLLLIKKRNLSHKDIELITWDELISIFESNFYTITSDCRYSLDILKNSIERAKSELQTITNVTFKKIGNIQEIITQLPQLLNIGMLYVGFSEGFYSCNLDLQYFEKRSHYRISKKKYSDNWIPIEDLISRYISLKYK